MELFVSDSCGFCVGVRHAVSLIESVLKENPDSPVYSLGMFIHNEKEIERLKLSGLKVVDSIDDVPDGSIILLPSHGTPPEIKEKCRQKALESVDLICTYVKKLQEIALSLKREGFDVVMIGDKDHPEVRAVRAIVGDLIVVDKAALLNDNLNLSISNRYGVISQTTQSLEFYREAVDWLLGKAFPKKEVRVYNTICWDVVERQAKVQELASQCDVVFVLGGRKSANTRRLFEISSETTMTILISDLSDFLPDYVKGKERIGIISGTSTPMWFVDKFIGLLNSLDADIKMKKDGDINGQ